MRHLVVALLEQRFARLTSAYEWWLPILVIRHINLVDESRVLEGQLPASALNIDICHRVVKRVRLSMLIHEHLADLASQRFMVFD